MPAVLLVGQGKLANSIAANILLSGQAVTLLAPDTRSTRLAVANLAPRAIERLTLLSEWPDALPHRLAMAVTEESSQAKRAIIEQLEARVGDDAIIAINTESIPLDELQLGAAVPGRIIGLNWSYPVHLSLFMEIVSNAQSHSDVVQYLATVIARTWNKDPYVVKCGFSVRARMMAAWAREAFYLVENGFASMESIDRACRNDAGHYLPFAGNFRYMDLMGTYAYGVVMKDLNPELSKMSAVPESLINDFQRYASVTDMAAQEEIFLKFSKEIQGLILKYDHEAIDR